MTGLYFEEESHSYYYEGEQVPCVSDVLEMMDVITMKGIPIKNIEKAAERGKLVHEATEDYEYGELDILDDDWQQENQEIVNYVYAYANFLKDHSSLPIASEEPGYSKEHNIAGTIDLVKMIDGKLAIVDKKTSKMISHLRSVLQLNAYRLIWNELHPDMLIETLYILQLYDNGEYRLIPIEIDEPKVLAYIKQYFEIKGDYKL